MKKIVFVIVCFFLYFPVFAQTDDTQIEDIKTNEKQINNTKIVNPALKLDFPLFDLPYQIEAMNTVGHGFFSSYGFSNNLFFLLFSRICPN